MDSDIWAIEESLWTGGRLAYATHMAADCLMAFPEQGLICADDILDAVDSAPRWRSVNIMGRHMNETNSSIVLGYHARAQRDSRDLEAICTSVYRRDGGVWKLIHHHQTLL